MSEFHPNRSPLVRTKPKLTKRRILESWPVLVWAGVLGIGFYSYTSGVQFSRMNGAVDVQHQYVAPAEDGRIMKIYVKQGDIVGPNQKLAEMDSRPITAQIQALVQGIASDRQEELLQLERSRTGLREELRRYNIIAAEDAGKLASLEKDLDKGTNKVGSTGNFTRLQQAELTSLNADYAEILGRKDAVAENIKAVSEDLNRMDAIIDKSRKDIEHITSAAGGEVSDAALAALTTSERADLKELESLLKNCTLIASDTGGVVESVDKLEGDFVPAGTSVVQVVADAGRIVAFLPQDQIANIKVGSPVWVTAAHNRKEMYEAKVISIGARIHSLLDPTSSMRNSRVYGRNVTVSLPEEVRAASKDAPLMIPGETLIIHTRPPGEIPIIDRIFHSDALDQ